ncbi:MscS Mechanosensitive ion channel [Pseudopedobacter saltans DSM 12145]|uniref:MscS Mechanosensitive ion channel n=1 Tax=Pseudopedobacter saltans (strain ATCC 51119 / DSM 12145 / JCM 21818 / CCUG 39354 / LMG 10337 / NBRC 100064 / NCIMB 13643) TaxID=762903 RepID=F0S6P5_PSESL|nr:mechanosensitive ion channel domain-containing protein [Pseudopedobacter saltans]ADY51121.1 MscS Mechanosensitive ion channel [Pseudopedobacter saltans DSM 12145]
MHKTKRHFSSLFQQYTFVCILLLSCFSLPVKGQDKKPIGDSSQVIPDTLLFKIQKAQSSITEINTVTKKGHNLDHINGQLDEIENNIAPVKADLQNLNKSIDSKTLNGYNLILKKSQETLDIWRTQLSRSTNDLQKMSDEVVSLSQDSLLSVNEKDSSTKRLYNKQLLDLKLKLQHTGKSVSVDLDTVSSTLAKVSTLLFEINDLQANINERMQASSKSAFGKESPYIWSAPKEKPQESLGDLLSSSFKGQNKIISYFVNSTWDNRILLLLFSIGFFIWVYLNFKKAQNPEVKQKLGDIQLDHIKPIPILSTLIVLINLTPLFEPDSPSLYIEIMAFLLIVILTIAFWRNLPRSEFKNWLIIVTLYILITFAAATVRDSFLIRICLIILNLSSLYIGSKFYLKLQYVQIAKRMLKPVLLMFLVFNLLSVIFNVFGRISLATTFSLTAIIGLTQVIGLVAFILILIDAIELQIRISAYNEGLFSRVNLEKTRASFKKVLSLLAVILWLLVFMINMGISEGVFTLFEKILTKPRNFGSVSFTLNNILFFALILYISNWLQKNIEILFGEKSIGFSNVIEHKSSKLTLIRLIVAILGILLAITASGIPLDKLTVVLGALSVGIGLGMQNIVNNFVSGIILIFEKPFHIGDYIELADKKGKIKDIGIRSSRMITQQGAEVIIPNADLLSNRFVNWTTNKAYVKSEIILKVNSETDIETIRKIVEEEVGQAKGVVKKMAPEVLINNISADAIELKILVWINNIYAEPLFKNHLFTRFLLRFKELGIKVV